MGLWKTSCNERYDENILHLTLPKGTTVFIESFDELVKTISELFFGHKINEKLIELKEKIVQNHNYYNDNKSSNRIFNILVKKNNSLEEISSV